MIIIPKRSTVMNHVPTPEQLQEGEIAINIAKDGEKIYVKNAAGEIVLLGGSELYTIIAETRDFVGSSIATHNSSTSAHSDIREAIKVTYTKDETTGEVSLKDTKSLEELNPKTLEEVVYDDKGISLSTNLDNIRTEIGKRNICYTLSDDKPDVSGKLDGTNIILGEIPEPSVVSDILDTDTISTAIGKLVKMIKG